MAVPTKHCCDTNPFKSPIKVTTPCTPKMLPSTRPQQLDVLATADLLLDQLKELETLCSTVEERVQRKRRALRELEYLILGSDNASPHSPACPVNTPISSRLHLVSPRLRGLFDLRGPGQANLDAMQSCLDYSPEVQIADNLSMRDDPGHSDEWVDDEEEGLLCPFDDKYAVRESPRKVEKALPRLPRESSREALESRIPKKVYVSRQISASKRLTGRSSGTVARNISHRRRSSLRSIKAANAGLDITSKGTMRQDSWKRSISENVKTKGSNDGNSKVSPAIENESVRGGSRRREKRKGMWSIYSVCSELGMGVMHHAA